MSSINRLSLEEMQNLYTWNPAKERLATRQTNFGSRIVKLSHDKVTPWQKILQFFGDGDLVDIDLDLTKITERLALYSRGSIRAGTFEKYEFSFDNCGYVERQVLSEKLKRLYEEASQGRKTIKVEIYEK